MRVLGEFLKASRAALHWQQSDLAVASGLAPERVAQLESADLPHNFLRPTEGAAIAAGLQGAGVECSADSLSGMMAGVGRSTGREG